ncbi:MAG: M28 family peptidase [Candidatus Aminicenantes bacterium]|nr:M28 family peptidase [Candidatus Aminicenantes bacterium]
MKIFRIIIPAALILAAGLGLAQMTSWHQWTFLPSDQMDEIIGEISGETAYHHIIGLAAFARDRKPEEFAGMFGEAQYVLDRLKEYGLADAAIVRFPGGQTWDGVKGELWEVSPGREKIASYQDLRTMLVPGSAPADVTAELLWVGDGRPNDFEGLDVAGKIVVTSGSASSVHSQACGQKGALGVVSFASQRPLFDPLQIPWGSIGGRRGGQAAETKFAFSISPREGYLLRNRLQRGEKISVRAVVESSQAKYELQDIVASIPGTDPHAEEVILTAHLFEGYTKFGANDNASGCAAILETGRTLRKLIDEGRIPPPKRTIRFLWAPEFSGTIPYVNANLEQMGRTLCNINLDMVGVQLTRSLAFFCFMRSSYGNPHYVNDVVENYFRYVGESTRDYVTNGMGGGASRRIVAPTGSEEPLYYYVGTDFGASDHAVFNDWGVGVPGLVLNTWPDQWYHTSGDRPEKIDPTQMKRAAIITAASAYTIASADDRMAGQIAAEIVSNASFRIGHQLARGLDLIKSSSTESFPAAVKKGRAFIEAAAVNERATLESVDQLVSEPAKFEPYLDGLKASVTSQEQGALRTFDENVQWTARILGLDAGSAKPTEIEARAAKIIPKPVLDKIRAEGYGGYQAMIQEALKTAGKALPNLRRVPTDEVQLLCDGRNSALMIKKMLDTQNRGETTLEDVLAYLEILKKAGLVDYK